jgi:hypothetical protein
MRHNTFLRPGAITGIGVTIAAALTAVASSLSAASARAPFPSVPLSQVSAGTVGNPIIVTDIHDVMGGQTPKKPAFPKVAKKPGYLRGYVKNAAGKPLAGAKVLVTSSAVGGFGSGASAETNEQGYYEIKVPYGIARVWCAGYAVTYHGVRIANTLCPADGKLQDFDSRQGAVENFVFLPYGIANEATVSDNPVYSGGYYGASFTVSHWINDNSSHPQPWGIPEGSTVEITLTPQGPLVDGSAGRPLIIRKKMEPGYSYFQVNNVPVGRYTITAKLLHDGTTQNLRLKDNGGRVAKGGMTPKQTEGAATIIFRSESSDPGTLRVSGGNMERHSLLLEAIAKPADASAGQ